MNNDIIPFNGSDDMLPSDTRRSGKAISRDSSRGLIRSRGIDIETEVTLTKIDSNTAVTGAQMAAITRVAQAQMQFELLVPQAAGRLNMVADSHALTVVADGDHHQRILRRK